MQTVRATITFPYDLHEELRLEAFRQRKSLSRILIEKIKPAKKKLSIEEQLKKDFALFDKVGRSGLQIDLVKALREDRDRDMGRGLKDLQGSLSLTPIGRKLDLDEILERAERKEAKRLIDEN